MFNGFLVFQISKQGLTNGNHLESMGRYQIAEDIVAPPREPLAQNRNSHGAGLLEEYDVNK